MFELMHLPNLEWYRNWRQKRALDGRAPPENLAAQCAANLKYGFASTVQRSCSGTSCDYVSTHNSGFFSNCSTALEDVLALERTGIAAGNIDFSRGMRLYKDTAGKDVYPVFFERVPGFGDYADASFDALDVHKPYKDLPLGALHNAVNSLFMPSQRVLELAEDWSKKGRFNPESTIAIYYRGTDKAKEITLAPIEEYIKVVDKVDGLSNAGFEVLIQTDQAQVRQAVIERFGTRTRYFESLPVTAGTKGIHKLRFGRGMTREAFALQMFAAVVVMSKCAYVVASTCNVSAWIAFYRGNARNFYQFGANGTLIPPG